MAIMLWMQRSKLDVPVARAEKSGASPETVAIEPRMPVQVFTTVQKSPSIESNAPGMVDATMKPEGTLVGSTAVSSELIFDGAEVASVPEGLAVTIRFKQSHPGSAGDLMMSTKLVGGTDATIVDLTAVGKFATLLKRVSEGRKIATLGGKAAGEEDLSFRLVVSSPASVDVAGTRGLKPFRLDIKSSGAKVLTK